MTTTRCSRARATRTSPTSPAPASSSPSRRSRSAVRTHNAATLCQVMELAGENRDFEFQCLHGMGETLYDQVWRERVRPAMPHLRPVGTHETLLAYLVRRLLENGANSSFVNQNRGSGRSLERLLEDPVTAAMPFRGSPHPRVPAPPALYPTGAIRAASISPTSMRSPASMRRSARPRCSRGSPPRCWASGHRLPIRAAPPPYPTPRARARSWGCASTPPRPTSIAPSRWRARPKAGGRARPGSARASWRGPRISSRKIPRASSTLPFARPARRFRTPSARSARRSTSAATTRCAFARSPPASPRRGGVHQPLEFPAGDLPGPGRRRAVPRATPSSPSPRSRRPSSRPRPSASCGKPACRRGAAAPPGPG